MTHKVTVADFGAGNLLSVERALRHCGADVELSDIASEIRRAERLVLPGVGAFNDVVAALNQRKLIEPLLEFAQTGRPFLGICVGLQLMFDVGEEFGEHPGLGLIPGRVTRIPDVGTNGRRLKVPHIGWNSLQPSREDAWHETIFETLDEASSVYFVHSYQGVPSDPSHRLADCFYGGNRLTAAVRNGSLFGCQFHPEKSGVIGLKILNAFVRS